MASLSLPKIQAQADSKPLYIRRATPADSPALSRICLLTADAGKDARALHAYAELPGLYYAVPYVHLPGAGGFVLARHGGRRAGKDEDGNNEPEDEGQGGDEDEEVLGYILYALDSIAFSDAREKEWLPPLRAKYPLPTEGEPAPAYDPPLKEADLVYVKRLHKPDPYEEACLTYGPTHMHINILPEVQRQGWGRRLLATLVQYLRGEGRKNVFLGYDPRNADAATFYARVGFKHIEGAPVTYVGLNSTNFDDNMTP